MIELRHLRYLVAVAEEGHVTRAAERLGIQQPPLTRQIRALEAELGVTLFERLPRGVKPTEAGRVVVEAARDVIERAGRLKDVARRAARGEQGRLAVGYTSSGAFNPFIAERIRAFRQARPGVQLALAEDGTTELIQALRDGRLDVAFVRSTPHDLSGLSIEPLLEEEMVAALPADHRLAPSAGPIPLSALADDTFVFYRRPTGPGLHDAIMAACLAAGFSPEVGQEAPRMSSTLGLVASGLGVSIVPASMRQMNMQAVAFVRLAGAGPVAPILLASRRGDRASLVQRFREEVREAARKTKAGAGLHDQPRPETLA
ncbi:LysR family transcriptional regulator [Phenylobacterium sp.]|uniref:LysR family transcriptional regulator n=1 Tax=Phenylobacterium sp. TaxID=1871053 RepID=UPI0035B2FA99